MDRRAFLGALGLLAVPRAAEAQQAGKVDRVGWVGTGPLTNFSDPTNLPVRAFRAELRDRGYVEGQNLMLEVRSVDGKIERAPGVMAELVRLGVDVIVSTGPEMTRAAKRVTSGVPIVMFSRA